MPQKDEAWANHRCGMGEVTEEALQFLRRQTRLPSHSVTSRLRRTNLSSWMRSSMSSVLIRILRKVTLVPGPSVSLVLLFDGDNLGLCPICVPPPLSGVARPMKFPGHVLGMGCLEKKFYS